MATNSGTLVLHVSSTSRLRYSYDREAQVNEAVRKLSSEGKRVVNIVDGPVTPFGPLGNVYSDVTIIWENNQQDYYTNPPTESIVSPKPIEKASVVVTSDNYASVLSRIDLFLEDEEWEKAKSYCDAALDFNSTSSDVYLRLVLAEERFHDINELFNAPFIPNNNRNFEKAIRFSVEPLKAKLLELKAKWESNPENYQGRSVITDSNHQEISIFPEQMLAAGYFHSVGLKTDGTVLATHYKGNTEFYCGACDVSSWNNIIAIASSNTHTVGLKQDGTVIATEYCGKGFNQIYYGQCDVSGWTDIIAVAAGNHFTLGLKKNGRVVAVGMNLEGACNVSNWENIVAISAGDSHSVGLKADGTVVATGLTVVCSQSELSSLSSIVAISAGKTHTVCLKSDGTVVAIKHSNMSRYAGQCEVSSWKDIIAVSAGIYHTVGIRSDGTVVATRFIEGPIAKHCGQCEVESWRDIVAVDASLRHTIGLKKDGTVISTRLIETDPTNSQDFGQCDVQGWRLFEGNLNSTEDVNKYFAYKVARLAAAKQKEEEDIKKRKEEARLQQEKERIQQEETKRRYEEYWTAHADERAELIAEKDSIKKQISSLAEQHNTTISDLNRQLDSIHGIDEVARIEERINKLTAERAGAGLFKSKLKKELQEQIDKATAEKADAQKKVEAEKADIETRMLDLARRIKEEIARLKLRLQAIEDELNKAR